MKNIYLVIGCPGAGKSWVCEKLTHLFEYVPHDLFIGMPGVGFAQVILEAAETAERPLLTEAPFSISVIKNPLENAGHTVVPVFIIEDHEVISERYRNREGKEIPKGHLTRQETYLARAQEWESFTGTSEEVFEHLKSLVR